MDDFDGLSIQQFVAIGCHFRIVCVPFFEIHINIVIVYCICSRRCRCFFRIRMSNFFPFVEFECLGFHDNFSDDSESRFIERISNLRL